MEPMELNDYLNLPYTITLRRDDEGDWIARVQELSGCTAHGSTEMEALEHLKVAKREWLEAALEDRVSVPLPDESDQLPSGKWVQRVSRSLHQRLARLAKIERISLNQLVSNVLSEYVGRRLAKATTDSPHVIYLSITAPIQSAAGAFYQWVAYFGSGKSTTPVGTGDHILSERSLEEKVS